MSAGHVKMVKGFVFDGLHYTTLTPSGERLEHVQLILY